MVMSTKLDTPSRGCERRCQASSLDETLRGESNQIMKIKFIRLLVIVLNDSCLHS